MKSYKLLQRNHYPTAKTYALALLLTAIVFSSPVIAQKKSFSISNQTNPLKENSVSSNRESHPFFIDIDGDGDLDCFSGEYTNGETSKVYYYRNDGTNTHPVFKTVGGQANPLNGVVANRLSIPYFIDIDGDGDYDCFIGEGATGAIMYYKNTGSAKQPDFEKQSAAFNPLSMVKFFTSDVANPAFADVDGDGDEDCLVVDEAGMLSYFKNTGTVTQPVFAHMDDDSNPFKSLSAQGGIYNVSFEDWNKDGLMDLFVNTHYYKNIGTQRRPQFAADDNDEPVLQSTPGYKYTYTPLRWVDLNNDGTKEVIQGNANGGFTYQTLSPGKTAIAAVAAVAIQVSPNPAKYEFTLNISPTAPSVIRVTDVLGKLLSTHITSSNIVKFGAELKPGIYVVQVLQNNKVAYSQKIIKE